jgi:hypothetical protein
MPEELAIALVVLAVIGWILFKVFQVLAEAAESVNAAITKSLRKSQTDRHEKKRLALRLHCRQSMPSDLNAIKNRLAELESDLTLRREEAAWVPEKPRWQKIEFVPQRYVSQGPATLRVKTTDLYLILQPNMPAWHEVEEELISSSCSYPGDFVVVSRPQLTALSLPDVSIEPASPICTDGKISSKEMDIYFKKELDEIAAYNKEFRDRSFGTDEITPKCM